MTRSAPAPRFVQLHRDDDAARVQELVAGLQAQPARIAPKFLYDHLGSRLFEAITELDEYYPTRTEADILERHAGAIAERIGPVGCLIDLGAGNCAKAMRLLPVLRPTAYLAVDISIEFLREALQGLQQRHPELAVAGLGIDFAEGLSLPDGLAPGRPVFFYPGSSIGNFTPEEALPFLTRLRRQADGGGLLIGVDLVKPAAVLEAAYDDALGVTAAFNLNLLRHVNRMIGSDFSPRDWAHEARWNAQASRIEMHLRARRVVDVRWPGAQRRFEAGESIHTENACKYTVAGFNALLHDAGFHRIDVWTDAEMRFAIFCALA